MKRYLTSGRAVLLVLSPSLTVLTACSSQSAPLGAGPSFPQAFPSDNDAREVVLVNSTERGEVRTSLGRLRISPGALEVTKAVKCSAIELNSNGDLVGITIFGADPNLTQAAQTGSASAVYVSREGILVGVDPVKPQPR